MVVKPRVFKFPANPALKSFDPIMLVGERFWNSWTMRKIEMRAPQDLGEIRIGARDQLNFARLVDRFGERRLAGVALLSPVVGMEWPGEH
jgi:hypothetical protein